LAMSFFLYIILQALASSQIVNLISEWVNMHSAIIPNMNTSLFFGSIVSLLVIFFVISFLLTAYIIQYNTLQCQLKSTDLLENIENWNGPNQQLLSA
ncbi:MAG: putative neutral ceramidase superfamily lipid hydrolase, partial [Saprospiraceae bacterium]